MVELFTEYGNACNGLFCTEDGTYHLLPKGYPDVFGCFALFKFDRTTMECNLVRTVKFSPNQMY